MSFINKVMSVLGLSDEEQEEMKQEPETVTESDNGVSLQRKGATVVNLHTNKQVRVVLCDAKDLIDAQTIADHLRSRKPVVINLQQAQYDVAMRILDFVSGTIYALGGKMEKLGQHVFLCAPENVEIQGGISQLMEGMQHE